jgi:hypothetical protein
MEWNFFFPLSLSHTEKTRSHPLLHSPFPCPLTQVYYVYGFMLLVAVILLLVTACVTIVGSYFLLNAENYHWQWTSFGGFALPSVW